MIWDFNVYSCGMLVNLFCMFGFSIHIGLVASLFGKMVVGLVYSWLIMFISSVFGY